MPVGSCGCVDPPPAQYSILFSPEPYPLWSMPAGFSAWPDTNLTARLWPRRSRTTTECDMFLLTGGSNALPNAFFPGWICREGDGLAAPELHHVETLRRPLRGRGCI